MSLMFTCLSCGGDGKETCDNPDHGFIAALGFTEIGRLGCPACGHHEDHKVRRWDANEGKYVFNTCYECNGTGEMTEQQAIDFVDMSGWDGALEEMLIPNTNESPDIDADEE